MDFLDEDDDCEFDEEIFNRGLEELTGQKKNYVKEVEVPKNVVMLASLTGKELKVINSAEFLNPSVVIDEGGLELGFKSICGEEYPTRVEMIEDLFSDSSRFGHDKRMNLHTYGVPPELFERDANFVLGCSRRIRELFPLRDKATKDCYGNYSGSTASKFYYEDLANKRSIFFGNAHAGHQADAFLKNNMVNIDPMSDQKGCYRKGFIQDWKAYVDEYKPEVIYSDAAVGDKYGFGWWDDLNKVYQQMINSFDGHLVLKLNFDSKITGFVEDVRKPRPHNAEVIVRFLGKVRGKTLDLEGVKIKTKMFNSCRTRAVVDNCDIGFYPRPLRWANAVNGRRPLKVKIKDGSRFTPLKVKVKNRKKKFIELCKKRDFEFSDCVVDPIIEKRPLVFMDYLFTNADEFELMNRLKAGMEKQGAVIAFDDVLGWYAE